MKIIKSVLISIFILLLIVSCGNNQSKKQNTEQDSSIVNVYYFHGKQRCKTCIAVGEVTKETVKKLYADNPKVKFTEVNTNDKEHEALVEKYEVTWNALIIAKGDNLIDITEQAFANSVNNPAVLENLIKQEINQQLNN